MSAAQEDAQESLLRGWMRRLGDAETQRVLKSIGGKPQIEAKEKLVKEKLTSVSSVKKRKLADDSPLLIPKA